MPAAELEEEEELIHEKIVEAAKWSAVMQYVRCRGVIKNTSLRVVDSLLCQEKE